MSRGERWVKGAVGDLIYTFLVSRIQLFKTY